ncbi:ephrin type-A receptor 1-like [Patiria miniata]|uniref:Receptor protein-tyrosine kinase n=1 Tax=Patiria miniata TaxID=46514 RepID=A0A914APE3_PATMI|nr:ephrin type-A receptor 1-like [Patiria miniata]
MTDCNSLNTAFAVLLVSLCGVADVLRLVSGSCQSSVCMNGGSCISYQVSTTATANITQEACLCPEAFTGQHCEESATYIYLEWTAYAVLESEPEIHISVFRFGVLDRFSTVAFQTQSLGAVSGSDFESYFQVITFEPGAHNVNVTIPIIDDFVEEDSESFAVSLKSPSGASLEYPYETAVVHILDDDSMSLQVFPLESTVRVSESVGIIGIELLRSGLIDRVVNVTVSQIPNNSTYALARMADSDLLSDRMQSFRPGEHQLVIFLQINDNDKRQGTREFSLMYRVRQDSLRIDFQDLISIIIDDDENALARPSDSPTVSPGQAYVYFVGLPYITKESDGPLQIPIFRLGDLNVMCEIEIYTSSGTAIDGEDFIGIREIITMDPFAASTTAFIFIYDEPAITEVMDEVFYVTMNVIEGGAPGRPSEQTVAVIIQADITTTATVQFSTASDVALESDGVITISVARQGLLDQQISVVVLTQGATAESSLDFIPMEGVVIFPPQSVLQTLEIEIIDDVEVEDVEWFYVTLGSVSQGMLGTPDRTEIMIIDDDGSAFTVPSSTEFSTTSSPAVQDFILYIIIAVVVVAVLVVIVIIVIFYLRYRRSKERRPRKFDEIPMGSKLSTQKVRSNSYLNRGSPVPIVKGAVVPQREVDPDTKEYPREKLRFYEDVGSGAFATVFRAQAVGIHRPGVVSTVAVKVLKETASESDKSDFLKELAVFKMLDPHPNIMTMLGCCTAVEPLYIILEFMPHGNLQGYLQRIRTGKEKSHPGYLDATQRVIQPEEVLKFASEICRGMEYLASKECIHRDLACRNILLAEDYVCKVSDFGLAREVEGEQQYEMKSKGRVPVRWLAPESLLHNLYTSQSDVWSFGVLMWELVTLGSHPYPGMSSQQVISQVQKGYRLPKPEHCSQEIYDMMVSCWMEDPEKRPTFQGLRFRIEAMLSDAQGYLQMDGFREDDYIYMSVGQVSDDEDRTLTSDNNQVIEEDSL